ncbi:hypothetical protein [Oceanirhabdus sp. W0125-5]|uniref:hypothetical protein n=1 Tax=Oceanirhabdus sp. W0125-5 TaxID=2999116 RepID=UPI0022F34023|nr:hypothetical protein [Oceanirhabdus sp. W0125-5]WBW95098.1 hypothetical protein OW730_15545 [Oceanirhabdus sp. W0125-5]
MFYFVKDVEENVMNMNCFYEVPFLEEAIYNISLEKMIKEYEYIKKWFMLDELIKHFQSKGAAGDELNFFLIDDIPYEELDYTHDVLQKRIKQKMGSDFEEFDYDLRLRLSRTCSRLLFEVKIKEVLRERI